MPRRSGQRQRCVRAMISSASPTEPVRLSTSDRPPRPHERSPRLPRWAIFGSGRRTRRQPESAPGVSSKSSRPSTPPASTASARSARPSSSRCAGRRPASPSTTRLDSNSNTVLADPSATSESTAGLRTARWRRESARGPSHIATTSGSGHGKARPTRHCWPTRSPTSFSRGMPRRVRQSGTSQRPAPAVRIAARPAHRLVDPDHLGQRHLARRGQPQSSDLTCGVLPARLAGP